VGVIKELVLLPVAPLRFTVWVAGYVAEEADRQEFSPEAAVRKLEGIRAARERGELDEELAEELEAEILQQQIERTKAAGGPGG
jgi:Gas vesicle protein G